MDPRDIESSPGDNGGFYACESPTGFSLDTQEESPAYVKWDFDLPDVPERIKKEATELRREIMETQRPAKKPKISKLRRPKPYTTEPTKTFEERFPAYSKAVNSLKQAIDSIPKNDSDSDDEEQGSSKIDSDKVFNDSLNEFFNECSQNVERNFYENNKPTEANGENSPESSGTQPENNNIIETPKTEKKNLSSSRAFFATPRNLCKELDELDDDLFLDVDI